MKNYTTYYNVWKNKEVIIGEADMTSSNLADALNAHDGNTGISEYLR